jgi:hypothetical protein
MVQLNIMSKCLSVHARMSVSVCMQECVFQCACKNECFSVHARMVQQDLLSDFASRKCPYHTTSLGSEADPEGHACFRGEHSVGCCQQSLEGVNVDGMMSQGQCTVVPSGPCLRCNTKKKDEGS